ncbi:cell division topological specificity factor MinE [Aggregatilineales bacterium SYSU G02658]
MTTFLDRLFGRAQSGSGSKAKERLQVVLIHDRFSLPPEKMGELKAEILAVISKYVQIDHESVDISLEQRDRLTSQIRAEIPFVAGRQVADPDEDVPDFVTTSNPAEPPPSDQ